VESSQFLGYDSEDDEVVYDSGDELTRVSNRAKRAFKPSKAVVGCQVSVLDLEESDGSLSQGIQCVSLTASVLSQTDVSMLSFSDCAVQTPKGVCLELGDSVPVECSIVCADQGVQADGCVGISPLKSVSREVSNGSIFGDVLLGVAAVGVDAPVKESPCSETSVSAAEKRKIPSESSEDVTAVCYSPISSPISGAEEVSPVKSPTTFLVNDISRFCTGGSCKYCAVEFPTKRLRLSHEYSCAPLQWSRGGLTCCACGRGGFSPESLCAHSYQCGQ
jgi:hypothetical protein